MKDDQVSRHNLKFWTHLVDEKQEYTRPWLELDVDILAAFTRGDIEVMPPPYIYLYPRRVFEGVTDKNVLCLATGGGQQSAAFGLLGAKVTVLDLTPGQLEADRIAAEHYGYDIKTIQGDMRDLSMFADDTFDLVYQAISICFVPEVRQVYSEVARIVKPGGVYRVGHNNPGTVLIEESSYNGEGYVLGEPYQGGQIDDADAAEYRHLLSDIFNGLVESGFTIESVCEDPRHLHHDLNAAPGTLEHMFGVVQQYFAIVSRRQELAQ